MIISIVKYQKDPLRDKFAIVIAERIKYYI